MALSSACRLILTYWSEAIDSRKYVVESDLPHEEWYTDCCDYATSETDEERYMQAKCMAETLGHMLQDIKNNYPNKYPAAMRTVNCYAHGEVMEELQFYRVHPYYA